MIKDASAYNLEIILDIYRTAFGAKEGIDTLVDNLLKDPSAEPVISLAAVEDGAPVGHILLTRATLECDDGTQESAYLLAPLAVLPQAQKKGYGGALINAGFEAARAAKAKLVFVLGYPAYYPRYGFETAAHYGFKAPYPIPEKHTDAWMVYPLHESAKEIPAGSVKIAHAIDAPEYWRE